MTEKTEQAREELEYTQPKVDDYGDLRELTATTGGAFSDVQFGANNAPNTGMSSP
jgi:hypothetical protein